MFSTNVLVADEHMVIRLFKMKNNIVFVLDLRIVSVKTCTGTTYGVSRRLIQVSVGIHCVLKKISDRRFIMRNSRLFVKLFVRRPPFLKKIFLSILNAVDDKLVL